MRNAWPVTTRDASESGTLGEIFQDKRGHLVVASVKDMDLYENQSKRLIAITIIRVLFQIFLLYFV